MYLYFLKTSRAYGLASSSKREKCLVPQLGAWVNVLRSASPLTARDSREAPRLLIGMVAVVCTVAIVQAPA